nr:MAG TPA: hypothetical protein [Caudoviricetes sp.]
MGWKAQVQTKISRLTSGFFHTSPFSMSAVSYDNRRPSTAH